MQQRFYDIIDELTEDGYPEETIEETAMELFREEQYGTETSEPNENNPFWEKSLCEDYDIDEPEPAPDSYNPELNAFTTCSIK